MKKNSGVLLVEALLALVVLSVAIAASTRSFTYASKTHRLLKNYLTALRLAEEKMAELEAARRIVEVPPSGVFEPPHDRFSWNFEIENLSPPEDKTKDDSTKKQSTVAFYKIHLRIIWRASEERAISVDTLVTKAHEEEETKEDEAQEAMPQGTHHP